MALHIPEITEYEPGEITPLVHKSDFIPFTDPDFRPHQTYFVRTVDINRPTFSVATLERVLARADRELTRIAEFCGGVVVPHTWGVIKEPGKKIREQTIVAAVDRIVSPYHDIPQKNKNMTVAEFNRLSQGCFRYRQHSRFGFGRHRLRDVFSHQFVQGYNLNTPDQSTAQSFLVDIEPRFRKTLDKI